MFSIENNCPYRLTKDTLLFNVNQVTLNDINSSPTGSICYVSEDRKKHCDYPFNAQACPTSNMNDFCDRSWAHKPPKIEKEFTSLPPAEPPVISQKPKRANVTEKIKGLLNLV